MLAAENGALPGGKVGGIADVIRDLPLELADRGWRPTVLTPGYGSLSKLPGATHRGTLAVAFAGDETTAALWHVTNGDARVEHLVVEHPRLMPHGPGQIYCDDADVAPFATDAGKFAFFSAAAASFVRASGELPAVVHLHDWHAAMYVLLREYDPAYRALKKPRTVFTIHNLALQGIRPLKEHPSSLEHWFPTLNYAHHRVADPRYGNCVNPMASAIRLADKLNTVSPTYAKEILVPNNPQRGYDGGEGLEGELTSAAAAGRLVGILNGCSYPARRVRAPAWSTFLGMADTALTGWLVADSTLATRHYLAARRLSTLPKRRPRTLFTSVGRLTAQKAKLYLTDTGHGKSALEEILSRLGKDGVLVLIGSGDPALEQRMTQISAQHHNFLFLAGYSEALSAYLYAAGDLFLMPSSFEPCGISQMLAMRAGQPCVVHAVGGLVDTVTDGVTGFTFDGNDPRAQAANFTRAVDRALDLKAAADGRWAKIKKNAAAARFRWEDAAAAYERELYGVGD